MNKTLGQIAFDASVGDLVESTYWALIPFSKTRWEEAAQAVRTAVLEECRQAIRAKAIELIYCGGDFEEGWRSGMTDAQIILADLQLAKRQIEERSDTTLLSNVGQPDTNNLSIAEEPGK